MKATKMFDPEMIDSNRRWLTQCSLIAALIAVGWFTGQLAIICGLLIVANAVIQGLKPQRKFSRQFDPMRRKASEEFQIMRQTDMQEFAHWQERLQTMNLTDAGPVLKLFAAIIKNQDRASKKEIVKQYLELEAQHWYEKLASVTDAIETCLLMGLMGSLLGILQAVTGGGGVAVIEQSMGVMAATSAIGAACAITLLGLSTRSHYAIARHIAELGIAANLMPGTDDKRDQDDDFFTLFGA